MNPLDVAPFIVFGAAILAAELIARCSSRQPHVATSGQGSGARTNSRLFP